MNMLFAPAELNPYPWHEIVMDRLWGERLTARRARLLKVISKHHPTATPEEARKILQVIEEYETKKFVVR